MREDLDIYNEDIKIDGASGNGSSSGGRNREDGMPKEQPQDNPKDNPNENPQDNQQDNDNPQEKPSEQPDDKPQDSPDEQPKEQPQDSPQDNDSQKEQPKDSPEENPQDNPNDKPKESSNDNQNEQPNDKSQEQSEDGDGDESEGEKEEDKKELFVVLKKGSLKGFFVELLDYDADTDTYTVEIPYVYLTSGTKLTLKGDELCKVGDIVDYQDLDWDNKFGKIEKFPSLKDVESGNIKVLIVNQELGYNDYTTSGRIICLHKEQQQEPETDYVECKTSTFLFSFLPDANDYEVNNMYLNRWYFPAYVVGIETYKIFNEMLSYVEKKMKDDGTLLYVFDNDAIKKFGKEKLNQLDEKLLKAYILALKNKPKYFKTDGYRYYFFDKLAVLIKNVIADSNTAYALSESVYYFMTSISENEVLLVVRTLSTETPEMAIIITLYEDSLDIRWQNPKEIFGKTAISLLTQFYTEFLYNEVVIEPTFSSDIIKLNLLQRMQGFLNLLK